MSTSVQSVIRGRALQRILKEASQERLAQAVQQNQAEWIRFEGQLPDTEVHADEDVTWICSAAPGRPNSVALACFDEDAVDRRLASMLARYQHFNASTIWWVGPDSKPSDLSKRLRTAGFHCMKHFPAMALDLRRMKTGFSAPKGLKIERVRNFDLFSDQEHPFFGPPTTERRRSFIEGERILCSVQPQRAYAFIATIDREPLGHVLLFFGAGVVGVYDVGVVRRARGRGIGTAVTVRALKFASRLGYRYAVLQASGEGERVYQRIGFEEVCRLSLWFHSKRHHFASETALAAHVQVAVSRRVRRARPASESRRSPDKAARSAQTT